MEEQLLKNFDYLGLTKIRKVADEMAADAAKKSLEPMEFFSRLIEAEASVRRERTINRKIKNARFPVIKSVDDFDWEALTKINRDLVRFLFRLDFIEKKENIAFLGFNRGWKISFDVRARIPCLQARLYGPFHTGNRHHQSARGG